MQEGNIVFNTFKGIVRAVAAPAKNTFRDLVNLRNDKVFGGLISRTGLRREYDISYQPDAVSHNKFLDIESLVSVGGQRLTARPAYRDGAVVTDETDIIASFRTTIDTIAGDVYTLTAIPTSFGLRYSTVRNERTGEYLIVKTVTGNDITLYRTPVTAWADDDELVFSLSLFGVSPFGINIANETLVPNEDVDTGGWTTPPLFSKINTRLGAGIYSGSLAPASVRENLVPDSTLQNLGWSIVGAVTVHEVLADSNDTTYIQSGLSFTTGKVGFANTATPLIQGTAVLRARAQCIGSASAELGVTLLDNGVPVGDGILNVVEAIDEYLIVVPESIVLSSNGDNLQAEFYTLGSIVRITKCQYEVLTAVSFPAPTFKVGLTNLVGAVSTDGLTTISIGALQTAPFNPVLLTIRVTNGVTDIIPPTYLGLTPELREQTFVISSSLITNYSTLELWITAKGQTANNTNQAHIRWIEAIVQVSEFAAGTFSYKKIAFPRFHQIDKFGNLYLSGIVPQEDCGIWIGRIKDRKYFADAFRYDGLYASPLLEELNSGVFSKQSQNIQVKIESSSTASTEILTVNAIALATNWVAAGGAATILEALQTQGDTKYARHTAVSNILTIGFTNPSGNIDRNGMARINVQVFNCALIIFVFVNGVQVGGITTSTGGGTLAIEFPAAAVANFDALEVSFVAVSGPGGSEGQIGYVNVEVPIGAADPIDGDGVYALNVSLVYDGFNESKLLYDINYGVVELNPPNYVLANQLEVSGASRAIRVKISAREVERINRRVTAIRLYGGKVIKPMVWRFLGEVSLDSGDWTHLDGVYSTEFLIGDEINTEESYTERNKVTEFYTPVTKAIDFASLNNRSFIINSDDRRVINFSESTDLGFMTSVLAPGSFFQITDGIGDLVGLLSINSKLVAFKENSHYGVNDIPYFPKLEEISSAYGLASLGSIAYGGDKVAYFVSYGGVHLTDGFSSPIINFDWIEDFRSYSRDDIRNSIGFYDVYSDSYYILFGNKIMWVYDSKTRDWRREDFQYDYSESLKFGLPSYFTRKLDGRTLIVDTISRTTSSYMQMYEFPRPDGVISNKIRTPLGEIDIPTSCFLRTNSIYTSGLLSGVFIDKGYIESDALTTVGLTLESKTVNQFTPLDFASFKVYDGDVLVKSVETELGEEWFDLNVRRPVVQISVELSFRCFARIMLKEIGLYAKILEKAGSVKQLL